jgi:hypothetical protein
MKRVEPSQNGHAKPDSRALYEEIAAAQQALTQARGRALEARSGEELAAVLACLRRVSIHVDDAVRKCVALRNTRE